MKIVKGETKDFELYRVTVQREVSQRKWKIGPWEHREMETETQTISNVLEADEETGRLIVQLTDPRGYAIYTNGKDEVIIESAVIVLMQMNQVRTNFLAAGFRPKSESTYETGLRIIKQGS